MFFMGSYLGVPYLLRSRQCASERKPVHTIPRHSPPVPNCRTQRANPQILGNCLWGCPTLETPLETIS